MPNELYAVWERKTYTVKASSDNNGNVSPEEQTVKYGADAEVIRIVPNS